MPKQFDIVAFGICTVDFPGVVKQYPERGQKVPMEAFSKQGGGNTGTALTTAARLGAKTAYIGKFGRDEYSLFLLEEFQKEGVDVHHVTFEEGAQPHISFIHVDKNTGEKRITRYWKEFKLRAEELNRSIVQDSQILFLDHYYVEAGLVAVKWIKESAGNVVVDAERFTPGFGQILKIADYIIASNKSSLELTGNRDPEEGVKYLQKEYGKVVVVTAGEKGAFCQTSEVSLYQPAFRVKVMDTTGAGDVFHGAFMADLIEKWPLRKILEFSAAVAALKCRGLGGRAPIPAKAETLAFLKVNGTPEFWI